MLSDRSEDTPLTGTLPLRGRFTYPSRPSPAIEMKQAVKGKNPLPGRESATKDKVPRLNLSLFNYSPRPRENLLCSSKNRFSR